MSNYRPAVLSDTLEFARKNALSARNAAQHMRAPLNRNLELERAEAWDWVAERVKDLLFEEQPSE